MKEQVKENNRKIIDNEEKIKEQVEKNTEKITDKEKEKLIRRILEQQEKIARQVAELNDLKVKVKGE